MYSPTLPVPTDNLYKFLALSGVLLIITSVYLFQKAYFFRFHNFYQARIEVADTEPKSQEIESRLGTLIAAIDSMDDTVTDRFLVEKFEALGLLNREVSTRHATVQYFKAKEKLFDQGVRKLGYFCLFFGGIGFLLSCSGFYLWYRRVQRPLDVLLAKKSNEA